MSDPVYEDDKPWNDHDGDANTNRSFIEQNNRDIWDSSNKLKPYGDGYQILEVWKQKQTVENIAHQAFSACSLLQKEAKQACCPKWGLYNR